MGLKGLSLVLLACTLACSLVCTNALDWRYCEGEEWEAKVHNVSMSPDPARAGGEINIIIDGKIGREVQGGELDLKVLFHGIPVYKETDDLCDRTSCPANGDWIINAKQKLPKFALPGKYELQVNAMDSESSNLVCLVFGINIKPPHF